jgi:RNase adaptor protein for sRNA GlmZ degradation
LEGKVLYSGCDGRHFEVHRGRLPPDIYHRPLPTTIIDTSNLSLAGLSEPCLSSFGLIVDNPLVLLPFPRDGAFAFKLASAAGELFHARSLPNPFAPNHSPTSMD